MATAKVASASLGPQYAPDDPTLVKPWKGLIDGSTGVLYYWNPESNVTQYEKPPNLDPIPPSFTPKLAPLPAAQSVSQQQQDVQPWGQYAKQTTHIREASQPHVTHPAQGTQPQHPRSVQQQSFQNDGQQFPSLQGQRFPSQQVQQMQYQQPNSMQAQQFPPPEGHKLGSEYQMGKHYRAAQPQQPAISSHQSHQHGPDPNLRHQIGGSMGQNQQHGGSSVRPNMGREEDLSERAGNGFYFNNIKEGPGMIPQQPKLAAMPMPHIQQGMRIPQGVTPSHTSAPNFVSGHNRVQTYNNTTAAQTFTKCAPSFPPSGGHESSTVTNLYSAEAYCREHETNLSTAEAYCREHEITATGDNVPDPFMTFEATGFPTEILREIQVAGFSSPTPIQAQTWPIAMNRKDIVAIAKTGSGKTLGYIIPAFLHLMVSRDASQNGPIVLILAPTRELATQIQDEVIKFGRSSRISCTCLYGGAPKGPQLKELERGADIVVATPGRLNDILEMNKIDFRQVSFLVLDEADRMLDMGFEPQIRTIVNRIRPHRQTLMYTATWPNEVKKIAGDLLVNPVQVTIGSVDVLAANKAITQHVEIVPQMNKQRRLEEILRGQERGSRALIFCSTKKSCDQLARSIGRNFGAAAIHGDKSQSERDWVLNQFRSGKSPVLVATDVAARGLDVKDIRVVINYDFPTGIEDYVHRIGRTGRAGAAGVAYTFFSDQDRKHAADLVKVLVGANQVVPPEVQEMAGRGGSSFRGGISRWNTGGHSDSGGRGGMRANVFDARSGGRDGGFGGGGQDVSFGGRGGRANFGGRGNQGQRFSGSGSSSVGWGRHDGSPHSRYDHDGPRQHQNGRGGGRISRGSYSRSPDMVRTWDTRSSSRSSSRSRSRSPRRSNFTRSPERRSERDHLKTESVAPHKPPTGTQGDDGSPALELPLHQGSPAGTKPDLQPVAEV